MILRGRSRTPCSDSLRESCSRHGLARLRAGVAADGERAQTPRKIILRSGCASLCAKKFERVFKKKRGSKWGAFVVGEQDLAEEREGRRAVREERVVEGAERGVVVGGAPVVAELFDL